MNIKWFHPYERGELTGEKTKALDYLILILFFPIAIFLAMALINIPAQFRASLIYLILLIIAVIGIALDRVAPHDTIFSTTNVFGDLDVFRTVVYGILLAIFTLIALGITRIATGQVYTAFQVTFLIQIAPLLFSILFTAVMVVFIEEALFNMLIAPTLGVIGGAVLGMTVSAVLFFFFHFLALGLGLYVAVQLVAFRLAASFFVFKYRNAGVGIIGHSLINLISMM